MSVAREVATVVLQRVARDDAWAARVLDHELTESGASMEEAALAVQIVYGTLRVLPELDAKIAQYAHRGGRVDSWTRALLRTSTYQLLHLARVPAHATVDEAVKLTRHKRGQRVAGFVNALLRKVSADRPTEPTLPQRLIVPPWVEEALASSLGATRAGGLLAIPEAAPSLDLRVSDPTTRSALAEQIRATLPNARVEESPLCAQALRLRRVGDPRALPGYQEGRFAVQEEGAQLAGALAGVRAGERVADVCAGRGGKSLQFLAATGATGSVDAIDLHVRKLEQIDAERQRLGLADRLRIHTLDLTVGSGDLGARFDRVVVDAPCTGLGTLRRRPEILLRLDRAHLRQMSETQRRILHHAAELVRPGGTLVYIVCSPLREEGADVVHSLKHPQLQPDRTTTPGVPGLGIDDDGVIRIGPWVSGADSSMDAYQVYRWAAVG